MPSVRFTAFKSCARVIAVIFLLNKIMLTCSRYAEKKLVYITIMALFNH